MPFSSFRTGKLVCLILMVCCAGSLSGYGQSKASLYKLIEHTHEHLNNYNKLNPFGEEYVPIDTFSLSKKETQALIESANYDASLSTDKKSIATYAAIFYFQDEIIQNLLKIMQHPKFNEVDVAMLLPKGELQVVVSEDHKLFNFTFPEKNGGSYRAYISLMHYTYYPPKDSLGIIQFSSGFAADGYSSIHQLETQEGTKYVLTGFVRGCNYCFETFVELVSFATPEPNTEFSYAVNNRSWEEGVSYHPDNQTIEVAYHTDDLTPYCYCDSDFSWDWNDVDEYNVPYISCQCKFVFNGTTFELVEQHWKKEQLDNSED